MKYMWIVVFSLLAANAWSTVWIVDNNPGAQANFTSLTDAVNGSSDNDTLYMIRSGSSYGGATVNHQITIFGPGYFLCQNPETQSVSSRAAISTITFAQESSNGSTMMGMYISQYISIQGANITIQRNRINSTHNSTVIFMGDNASNCIIIQNYINLNHYHVDYKCIDIGSADYVTIVNNYIYRYSNSYSVAAIVNNSGSTGAEIHNNVLYGNVSLYYANLNNNILRHGNFNNNASSVNYLNNLGSGSQFGTDNGNQSGVDMETVFIGTGSTDGQWQLADGSPAVGAGVNGQDCGMYGGTTPYVLSGMPGIPTITSLRAPASASTQQGLNVEIQIKARY